VSFPRTPSRTRKRNNPGPLEEAVALKTADTRWERIGGGAIIAGTVRPGAQLVQVGFILQRPGGETSIVCTARELDNVIRTLNNLRALMLPPKETP
jgi:hypothetical protein